MTNHRVSGAEAPLAPRTGFLRRVLGPFYFTGVFWYRLPLFTMRVLPEWLLSSLVRVTSLVFFLALGNVRRAVGRNQEMVWGRSGWWRRMVRSYRTIYTYSWCMAERYEQFVPGKSFDMTIENESVWDELLERKQGVIVVTSHVGNWELGSTLPTASDERLAMHVVREAELDPSSQRFIEGLLDSLGGPRYHTHIATDDPSLGLLLMEALRRGEVVALQADRPRAGGQLTRVRMFDHEVDLPLGPAALARLAGLPLLPVFTLRQGRAKYRVVFRDPVLVARTRDRSADIQRAMQEVARSIEWAVRTVPDQWFCFAEVGGRHTGEDSRRGRQSPAAR